MPSTFSPSLRIELIAPGEQAGTWNTTTNTNLGTLLESAIAGATTVSVTTTNQALTIADGAADQSRSAVLQFTTTTGAPFNVYAPPVSKQYTIYNTTAFAATIFNSTVPGNTTAAGTGITIPAGRTMTLWTNGTNFRVQNDHVIGDLVGNLNGNLTATAPTANTAAFGTNTTQVATTAFVQAALQALHPVGSVYINATNNANPSTYFGFGTWVAFGAGRVPVGFNAADPLFDTAEETGGSKDAVLVSHTHTTTVTDPGHFHPGAPNFPSGCWGAGGCAGFNRGVDTTPINGQTATTGITVSNSTEGSSGTNANLQPYITVFMWKRTA